MHHKFYILDGRDLLTGFYNWTNKAAHANEENVVLTTGDAELARHFLREFERLTGPPDAPATGSPAVERALKRLGVIMTLLALNETEDLPKHIERLEAEHLADARRGGRPVRPALRRGPGAAASLRGGLQRGAGLGRPAAARAPARNPAAGNRAAGP